MPLYQYVKAPPTVYRPRRGKLGTSVALMGIGAGILIWVLWPILSFAVVSDSIFSKTITPISDAPAARAASLSTVAYAASPTDGLVAPVNTDFTNANTWYPTAPQKRVSPEVNTYVLSIPKLRIKNAQVIIGGDDLSTSLIHYGGTGLPGQYGTTVVFGHSTLPQFYSPTNYKTIFSLLPTLKIGDDIFITYDGVLYRYVIYEMVVLDPTDLTVLEQRFDDSYLTLVTCVPPGTYWKRLNVKA